jgi:hypothetical protein
MLRVFLESLQILEEVGLIADQCTGRYPPFNTEMPEKIL